MVRYNPRKPAYCETVILLRRALGLARSSGVKQFMASRPAQCNLFFRLALPRADSENTMISLLIGVGVLFLAVIAGAVLDLSSPPDPKGADERTSATDLWIWTVPAVSDRDHQPGY